MATYRIIIFAASAVLAIGMIKGENPFRTYFELKESQHILSETVSHLQANVDDLNSEIDKINRSPSYAHKVLRDKYHVTDDNESIVFFAD